MTATTPDSVCADSPVILDTREHLFHLLAEAAEIEHTLMCTYLYAAFSLKSRSDSTLSHDEAVAVERWRSTIVTVATDEMVHLLLVANLSVALGGRPHFSRPNFPVTAGYFPSGVIAKLVPFSLATIDHFIYLERPRGTHREDGEGFEPDRPYEREEAFHGLMPSVQDYATVGDLYDAIRANLIAGASRLGEAALFAGPCSAQIGPDIVELDGVAIIDSLQTALAAVDVIVEQGEGSPVHREGSHFERFAAMRSEIQTLLARNPDFQPAWPASENPVMRRPPEPEEKIFIDNPAAAVVLDYGNSLYGVLLRCLVQAFGRQGPGAKTEQAAYLAAAIEVMHLLALVATTLVTLPASSTYPKANAGLTFTMLRGVEPFLSGDTASKLMVERLGELCEGAKALTRIAPALVVLPERMSQLVARFSAALAQ